MIEVGSPTHVHLLFVRSTKECPDRVEILRLPQAVKKKVKPAEWRPEHYLAWED